MDLETVENRFRSFLERSWSLSEAAPFSLVYVRLLLLFKKELSAAQLNIVISREKQLRGKGVAAADLDDQRSLSRMALDEQLGRDAGAAREGAPASRAAFEGFPLRALTREGCLTECSFSEVPPKSPLVRPRLLAIDRADPLALMQAAWDRAGANWRDASMLDASDRFGFGPLEGLLVDFVDDHESLARLREQAGDYQLRVWREALESVGAADESLAHKLRERFKRERQRHCAPFPEVIDTLSALRGRHALGIVSNGPVELQRMKLHEAGLTRFFDCMVVSGEFGRCKPDPRIFLCALERMFARPEETLMVGDHYDRDIEGARSAGIHAVWVRRGETSISLDPSIPDLRSLPSCISSGGWHVSRGGAAYS